MRDDETPRLPPGYYLDLISDPSVIILCRSDGTVVARFTYIADPEEIRRAAEEDYEGVLTSYGIRSSRSVSSPQPR